MALVHDALHHLGGMLGKVSRAEEGGFDVVLLQHVEYSVSAFYGHLHAILEREVHPVFAGHVKLLRVKAQ